jgi:hypothetical protein
MPTHPLHQAIGRLLDVVHDSLPADQRAACSLIKDPACLSGPTPNYVRVPQNIPLFCSTAKANATEFCNVDALILLGGKIKVIIEIEESALDPTQAFGKYLSSAAALCYIHDADGGEPVYKDEDVLFVQIMDTSSLKPRSSKRRQWENIEAAIQFLPTVGKIRYYRLFYGDEVAFSPGGATATRFAECATAVLTGRELPSPPAVGADFQDAEPGE